MSLKLKNTWNYHGDDWWEWEAFIDDGGSGEMKDVKFVEYILHETFPEPIQRIDNPKGGFRLSTEGWGTFEVKAFAHLKSGKKIKLTHELQLEQAPKKGSSK